MYKRILCAALAAILAASALSGCDLLSGSNDTEPSEESIAENISSAEESSQAESKASKKSKLAAGSHDASADWSDFEFTLQGESFEMPFECSKLLDLGWTIEYDYSDIKKGDSIEKNDSFGKLAALTNSDYDADIWINLVNNTDEDCKPEDAMVDSVDIMIYSTEEDTVPEMVLAGGITWGSTADEVKAAYGDPTEEPERYESLGYETYVYTDESYNKMELDIDDDTGIDEITLYYYGTLEGEDELSSSSKSESGKESDSDSDSESKSSSDASSSNASSKSSIKSESKAPSSGKLSSNWDSFEFILDGKQFKMLSDYKLLADMGWTFDLADYGYEDGYILNKGDETTSTIALENEKYEDVEFWVGFCNQGDKACDIKEGQVWATSVSIEWADEYPTIELPGGITWGSTIEEIEKAYGKPKDEPYYAESLEYYSYEYKSEDSSNGLTLTIYKDGGLKEFAYKVYSPDKL